MLLKNIWATPLLIVIAVAVYFVKRYLSKRYKPIFYSSNASKFKKFLSEKQGRTTQQPRENKLLNRIDTILFIVLLVLFSFLFVRPQKIISSTKNMEGIDIIILLDASGSMDETDISPSRLDASKQAILDFVENKSTNRIGLIAFEGSTAPLIPLTFDHSIFKESLDQISYNLFAYREGEGGTAIGDAIISATSKFTKDDTRRKVIILLSDGESNGGINVMKAVSYAQENGITIYPLYMSATAEIFGDADGDMKYIASAFGVELYKPRSENDINEVFNEIDSLEKSKIEVENQVTQFDNPMLLIYITSVVVPAYLFVKVLKENATS